MSEIRIQDNENQYYGVYPSVFKKINTADVNITPFQAHKLWTVYSGSSTSSALPLIGIYSDTTTLPAIGSELIYNDAKNIDNSLQTITYHSINHLFYKYKTQPNNTYGPTNLNRTKKFLFQTASILSIPQKKIGLGIKPESVTITSVSGTLQSDRYGNLYDVNISTASIVTGNTYYEGFNEYFDTSKINYISSGISYVPGIKLTSGQQKNLGLAASFTGSGFISTTIDGLYNRDNNYAISFFISSSNTGTSTQLILGKTDSINNKQYPFKIELSGSKQLVFSVSSNSQMIAQITSSAYISSSWNHVVCEKSGSVLNMYINSTLHTSASFNFLQPTNYPLSASGKIDNSSSLYIGGYSTSSANYIGLLDEIRIYNKSLSLTEIGYLSNRNEGSSLLQTRNVGNVFTQQGLIVISTPDYRYQNILNFPYTASYRSTINLYELGVITRINAGDFNMSLNPSLTYDNNITYQSFVSSSNFNPYITTIGLYNDAGQLLAIGKLAQPIRKRSDVDMNFLIRLDLDKNIVKG